jgi:glycosyltransferase involved in cell wall biosynthesis
MRVLHIGPSEVPVLSTHGGAVQRRIAGVASALARGGHEVVVVSPSSSTERRETREGWTQLEVGLRSRRPLRDLEFLAKSRRLLKSSRFDILHAHGSPLAVQWLGRSAEASVQTVDYFRYRFTDNQLGHAYYSRLLNEYRQILLVSAYCAHAFGSFYPRVSSPQSIVPNGVDLEQFRLSEEAAGVAREALGLPAGRLVVYLGRVCRQKGSDLLAPLARQLQRTHPDVTVVAAGPAEQFGAGLQTSPLMRSLEAAGVRVTGAVHEEHLSGLLNAAAVVVLPTRADEMFGMAALEALACGTPVVASDLGGIPEAVGAAGLLFPVGSVHAFHEAVAKVLDSLSGGAEWRQRARTHAKRFSWASVASKTQEAYESALAAR